MNRSVFHIIVPGEVHLQSRSRPVSLHFLFVPVAPWMHLHPLPYHIDLAFFQAFSFPLEWYFSAKLVPEGSWRVFLALHSLVPMSKLCTSPGALLLPAAPGRGELGKVSPAASIILPGTPQKQDTGERERWIGPSVCISYVLPTQ